MWSLGDDTIRDEHLQEELRADLLVSGTPITSATTSASNTSAGATASGLDDDQCSWCGFHGHSRKTKKQCPMHADYSGDKPTGVAVRPGWKSQNRSRFRSGGGTTQNVSGAAAVAPPSAGRRRTAGRVPKVPTSVLCAPTVASWTATHWTEGAGALADFEPETCAAPTVTKPHPDHGWTSRTTPQTLFDHFFKPEFRKDMLKWTNSHASMQGAGRSPPHLPTPTANR